MSSTRRSGSRSTTSQALCRRRLTATGRAGLAAVASAGGGARVPLITTTLSEHFGVPVITTPQPELTPAIGGGLHAARGTAEEGATALAEAVAPPTAAAAAVAATQMAPEIHGDESASGGSSGLAWSEADDVPDIVAPTDPYDYGGAATTDAMGGPRPQMQFEPETGPYEADKRRTPFGLLIAGLVLVLLAIALAVWFVLRSNESTPSPSSTTVSTTAPSAPPTSEARHRRDRRHRRRHRRRRSHRPSRRRSRASRKRSRRKRRRHLRRVRRLRHLRRRQRPRRRPRSHRRHRRG